MGVVEERHGRRVAVSKSMTGRRKEGRKDDGEDERVRKEEG